MDFERSVSEAHLRASGWDMGVFRQGSPFESHFIYINDVDHGQVNLFSVLNESLEAVMLPKDVPTSVLAYWVAKSLIDIRRGALQPTNDEMFLPKLIGYVKATKSFDVWKSHGAERLHFIINVYRLKQGAERAVIRPFAAECDLVVLPAKDMLIYSNQVLKADRSRHPEWFV